MRGTPVDDGVDIEQVAGVPGRPHPPVRTAATPGTPR